MKQKKNEMYWIMGFVLAVGSIPVFGKPFAKGPYMGQTPPGSTPQIFAPGFISDTRPHQLELWGSGAADKAAIRRVKVPPCQLPDSGT